MGKKRVIKKSEGELAAAGKAGETSGAETTQGRTPSQRLREGQVYIYSSYNNIVMTLVDSFGNVIANRSAGAVGFKGTKKSTPFAASKVAEAIAQVARSRGMEKVKIQIRGVGSGRDSALRSLAAKGFDIISIQDRTPIPHNGPRPPKVRRV